MKLAWREHKICSRLRKLVAQRSATLLITLLLLPNSAGAAERGWMIRQNGCWAGETVTYITNTAIKVVNVKKGTYIVATAPDWKPTIFNPEKKVIYTETLAELSRESQPLAIFASSGAGMATKNWKKMKVDKYLGHPMTEYKFEAQLTDIKAMVGDCYFANDIRISKDLARNLPMMFELPQVGLMPLWYKYIYRDGKTSEIIVTKEIKPFIAPAHFWEVPPHFKTEHRVFDMANVLQQSLLGEPEFQPKKSTARAASPK